MRHRVLVFRKDEGGLIFLTSEEVPELFIALQDASKIEAALKRALNIAFPNQTIDARVVFS